MKSCFFLLSLMITTLFSEKVEYKFSNDPIDVVIPCAEKDIVTLALCIEGIRNNVQNLRRIIVISNKPYALDVEWFDEKLYPFTKFDLGLHIFKKNKKQAKEFVDSCKKCGWIYQQFLKLYAPYVIPKISSNVLIVDADVIFYHPVEFLDSSGAGLYNPGTDNHALYFNHMKRLLPDLGKVYPQHSGISHHMLFQKPILDDLFSRIEKIHKAPAWQALCKTLHPWELEDNCLSEYEIYFNFAFSHTSQVKLRFLKWDNKGDISEEGRKADYEDGFDYVAYHDYKR